jgi:steroid delta-isomerase-like uncharacterized protein
MKKRFLLLAIMIAALACVVGAGEPKPGTTLVDKNFAAWNSHDPEKVVALYTDDVVYEDVTFAEVAHGREELKKMAAGFFAAVPDMKLVIVKVSQHGNQGSVEWLFSGTDIGLFKSGKKFSVRGASIFELRGGKFASNRDYYDSASIMRQVGVLPAAK